MIQFSHLNSPGAILGPKVADDFKAAKLYKRGQSWQSTTSMMGSWCMMIVSLFSLI